MGSRVKTVSQVIEVTPLVSTGAYAAGDQLGSLMELSFAVDADSSTGVLISASVVDKAKQKAEIDVFLFDDSPTVSSSDNAALDISDAELADKCLGSFKIEADDYVDFNASSVATKGNLGVLVKNNSNPATTVTSQKSIWAIVRSGGTPTYTSTSDLVFRFGVLQD